MKQLYWWLQGFLLKERWWDACGSTRFSWKRCRVSSCRPAFWRGDDAGICQSAQETGQGSDGLTQRQVSAQNNHFLHFFVFHHGQLLVSLVHSRWSPMGQFGSGVIVSPPLQIANGSIWEWCFCLSPPPPPPLPWLDRRCQGHTKHGSLWFHSCQPSRIFRNY